MANTKKLLNELLKKRKLTLAQINSKKFNAEKQSILNELIAVSRGTNKTKSGTFKDIRSTGLKFSNQSGRYLYDEQTAKSDKISYSQTAARIRKGYKASVSKIPIVHFSGRGEEFMYAAKVYCTIIRGKTLPFKPFPKKERKRIIKLNPRASRYMIIQQVAFWSEHLLNSKQVNDLFYKILTGSYDPDIDISLDGSNKMDLDFRVYNPVAFLYDRVIRNQE